MTARQAIITALCHAVDWDIRESFTFSDICVLVRDAFPEKFGMKGYEHLPDSKRVMSEVSVMTRAATQHYVPQKPTLERIGVNLYRLTQAGLDAGRILEASTRKGAA